MANYFGRVVSIGNPLKVLAELQPWRTAVETVLLTEIGMIFTPVSSSLRIALALFASVKCHALADV